MSLQELNLKAVPNTGEQARKVLPPWHMVCIALEEREFNEMRDRFREEHKLRFRYVLIELSVRRLKLDPALVSQGTLGNRRKWPL